jgi:hypothetical protein
MHPHSIILINVPHPEALNYIRLHTPEKLQIIDQSILADNLLNNTYASDLELISYTSYSLFHKENDSVLIKFKKSRALHLSPLSKPEIIRRKLIERIQYYLAKVLH